MINKRIGSDPEIGEFAEGNRYRDKDITTTTLDPL